ncbi:MAG: hypothetical protein ACLTI1_01350 [Clostridia bacterium]
MANLPTAELLPVPAAGICFDGWKAGFIRQYIVIVPLLGVLSVKVRCLMAALSYGLDSIFCMTEPSPDWEIGAAVRLHFQSIFW